MNGIAEDNRVEAIPGDSAGTRGRLGCTGGERVVDDAPVIAADFKVDRAVVPPPSMRRSAIVIHRLQLSFGFCSQTVGLLLLSALESTPERSTARLGTT